MKRVDWAIRAERELEDYLDWIAERDEGAAERIRAEITRWTELVAAHPRIGNANRYLGYYTHGYPRRTKRIIYRVFEDRIVVVRFWDTRQDERTLGLDSLND